MNSIRYQYNRDIKKINDNYTKYVEQLKTENPDRLTTIQQQDAEWMAYMKQLRLRDEAQMKRERKVINFMRDNL